MSQPPIDPAIRERLQQLIEQGAERYREHLMAELNQRLGPDWEKIIHQASE